VELYKRTLAWWEKEKKEVSDKGKKGTEDTLKPPKIFNLVLPVNI